MSQRSVLCQRNDADDLLRTKRVCTSFLGEGAVLASEDNNTNRTPHKVSNPSDNEPEES